MHDHLNTLKINHVINAQCHSIEFIIKDKSQYLIIIIVEIIIVKNMFVLIVHNLPI